MRKFDTDIKIKLFEFQVFFFIIYNIKQWKAKEIFFSKELLLLKKTKGYLMIAAAGSLWATIGFFVKNMLSAQVSLSNIIFGRMFLSFIILFFYLYFIDKEKLKIDSVLLKYVIAIGLFSQCLFNFSYISAIGMTSMATAVTLLYTAPIFIALMSRIFFHEAFTKNKIIALFLSVTGVFLAVTGGSWQNLQFNLSGILMGLTAGLSFGLLTILSKPITNQYHPYTIVFYSIGFGLLFYLPFSQALLIFQNKLELVVWLYALLLSIIATIVPYLCYVGGLFMGIEASKAGIISTIEVVIAVIISYLFFNEELVSWKLAGILMVIVSVIIVQLDGLITKRTR